MVAPMNQYLKDCVYCQGTQDQVDFMADLGGMNAEERRVFQYLHEGRTERNVQLQLGLSRKAYERIEAQVRRKLLVAVFHCIDNAMR